MFYALVNLGNCANMSNNNRIKAPPEGYDSI